MTIKLESWYTLKDTQVNGNQLIARFVPDHFSSDIVDPVITVVITEPNDFQAAAEALAVYSNDFINAMSVNPKSFEIWGEYDDKPLVVNGNNVTCQRSPYSQQDLLSIISVVEKYLQNSESTNLKLYTQLNEIEGFVMELLKRAETKKSLTNRATNSTDSQIDILERILNRISSSKSLT